MSRLALFAYGSLVSPESAAGTLGRPVEGARPAMLRGWSRRWTLARDNERSEKTFALADGTRPTHCLALNLEPTETSPAPNGVVIELSEAELRRLDARELRYRRVDVTNDAGSASARFDAVYAYVARPEHHRPTPPAGAVVIAEYLRTVEAAFATLGADELERFRASTQPPGAPVAEAALVHDEIPPGNPRSW